MSDNPYEADTPVMKGIKQQARWALAAAWKQGWAAREAAALPDERLREAGEAMAASIRELGRPIDDTTGGRWVRSKEALDAWVAALNAGETP